MKDIREGQPAADSPESHRQTVKNGMPAKAMNNSKSSADEPGDEPIGAVPIYKNFKIVIIALVVIGGGAYAAWHWYMGMRDFITTDDAYVDGNRVAISAKILGRIDSLYTDEGDTVRTGELLTRLDPSDLLAQEIQARAALALEEATLALDSVNAVRACTDFIRADTQFKEAIIPKEQYDHAQSALQTALAQIDIAKANITVARAKLDVVQTQLANTNIFAPSGGVVSKRWRLAGDVVSPGEPIFSIYDTGGVWVTAELEETNLGTLRLGDSVHITVDAYPGRTFDGNVFQIGANTASQFSLIPPNNAAGNFTKVTQRVPVKISIRQTGGQAQPPAMLLPGMSVEVKVKVRYAR